MCRLIVCGGRDYDNRAFLFTRLNEVHAKFVITHLMQGGAPGADKLAREWCRTQFKIQPWVCNADWTQHGKAAGPIRNSRMLEWMPQLVTAFPGGDGTADMKAKARYAGVTVIDFDQPEGTDYRDLIEQAYSKWLMTFRRG